MLPCAPIRSMSPRTRGGSSWGYSRRAPLAIVVVNPPVSSSSCRIRMMASTVRRSEAVGCWSASNANARASMEWFSSPTAEWFATTWSTERRSVVRSASVLAPIDSPTMAARRITSVLSSAIDSWNDWRASTGSPSWPECPGSVVGTALCSVMASILDAGRRLDGRHDPLLGSVHAMFTRRQLLDHAHEPGSQYRGGRAIDEVDRHGPHSSGKPAVHRAHGGPGRWRTLGIRSVSYTHLTL